MFYKYKIIEFTGKAYYYNSKKELFNLIDDFGFNRFCRVFTNFFEIGVGSVYHSTKTTPAEGYYSVEENFYYKYFDREDVFRSGNFVIRTNTDEVVPIGLLARDYRDSRQLNKKPKPERAYNPWAKQKRRPYRATYMDGLKHEIAQNLEDIREGYVKVRRKRHGVIKCDFDFEGHRIKSSPESWKKQKKEKQWL